MLALVVLLLPLAQGLSGLGAPGGLVKADPQALTFETRLLESINAARTKAGAAPVTMDERLRGFARREAEAAARGKTSPADTEGRVKAQALAPYGHRLQFGFGTDPAAVIKDWSKDASFKAALLGDAARAGVGAYYVPDTKPYFQLVLLLVHDADPLAGKPGLSPAQTDPVMNAAAPRLKACYDDALVRNPNARGDLLFRLVIGGDGRVSESKLLKSFGDPLFDACAVTVGQGLVFPAPYKGKPVTLHHPLRLVPPQGDRVIGRLTPAQVSGAFARAQADFKACYDVQAKAAPNLQGTITLGLTVSALGAVQKVDVVHDEMNHSGLTQCVLARAKQVRFPTPEFNAAVELTFPLRFGPSS